LISRLKIIFAVIIYVSCGFSMESCGVLRFSGIPLASSGIPLIYTPFLRQCASLLNNNAWCLFLSHDIVCLLSDSRCTRWATDHDGNLAGDQTSWHDWLLELHCHTAEQQQGQH